MAENEKLCVAEDEQPEMNEKLLGELYGLGIEEAYKMALSFYRGFYFNFWDFLS